MREDDDDGDGSEIYICLYLGHSPSTWGTFSAAPAQLYLYILMIVSTQEGITRSSTRPKLYPDTHTGRQAETFTHMHTHTYKYSIVYPHIRVKARERVQLKLFPNK